MGEQHAQRPSGGRHHAHAFLRAAARRWRAARCRLAAEAVQGVALAGRRELAAAMGDGAEGLSDGWGDPPNWLFAEPTGWIVGPALSPSRTRSEHTGGRPAVADGRDQGFN